MGDEFTPPQVGASGLPRRFLSAVGDAARDFRRTVPTGPSGGAGRPLVAGCELKIQNNTGGDIAEFAVLGIDGILFSPSDNAASFKSDPVLIGVTPVEEDHFGKFAIVRGPVRSEAIAPGIVLGAAVVRINITDASHKFADITDGDNSMLTSTIEGSARILYVESGTGTKWAVVIMTGVDANLCTPT